MVETTGSSTRFIAPAPVAAVCVALFAASIARADVIYVDDSATAGANTGQSWPDAFTDLQSALAIAKEFDEIRVAQGAYKPAPPGGPREATFNLVGGTVLRGGYAGLGASDPDANDPGKFETILSGDLNGDDAQPYFVNYDENVYHVATANAAGAGASLIGLTLSGGNADEFDPPHNSGAGLRSFNGSDLDVADCIVRLNLAYEGAGVLSDIASIRVRRTWFDENRCFIPITTTSGGGLYLRGEGLVANCLFSGNTAGIGDGGAIHVASMTQAIITRCVFRGNTADAGGAVSGSGVFVDCLLESNSGYFGGAALHGRFINCTFANNHAYENGGAIRNPQQAVNCLFIGNIADYAGGAILNFAPHPTLVACTFVGNRAVESGSEGGAIAQMDNGSSITLLNCIIWGNTDQSSLSSTTEADQIYVYSGKVILSHCALMGWTGSFGGVGNHGNDPRFIDVDGPDDIYGTPDDDPRLRANSPCVDSGDATLLPPDEFDLDDDGDVTEPLPIDLDGLPRVVGANLDMGAFEFQGIPCRADIDGDASVGIDDLLAVISGWGPCVPGEECNADMNLDSAVTLLDLQQVIDNWGACR